jgi:hypothetical protein
MERGVSERSNPRICLRLHFVSISPNNGIFRLRESSLEDFDGWTIYRYFGACSSVVIPSSVVVLGKWSFRRCKSLRSVIFESDSRLERIEQCAFSGSRLYSIEIPRGVTLVDEGEEVEEEEQEEEEEEY